MAKKINYTDSLRQGTDKLNESIEDANQAKQTANSAESKADNANSKADKAIEDSSAALQYTAGKFLTPVQTQTEIGTTHPNPSINDKVFVRDTGKTFIYQEDSWQEFAEITTTPVNEIDNRLSGNITTARKITDDRAFYEGLKLNRRNKALLTIVDDDGYPEVHQMLKPLVEQEGVPITTAVITSRVDTSSLSMTLQQIKECQASGMEVQSHTHTHQALADLTYADQETEIRTAKEWLQENGFSSEAIIYPFGSTNADTYEIVNRYHTAGIYIDSGSSLLNSTPIRSEKLERVYYNLTNPVTETDKNRIQHCKDKIDEAIANDSWIIIGLHCFYDGFDPEGLRQVIQYAKTQGIEITTVKRGLELYGNIVELPDFTIGADGEIRSNKLGHVQKMISATDTNTPLSNFPKDAYSYRLFNASSASSAGMPEGRAGVLETFRGVSDDYGYQFYRFNILDRAYKRRWDNTAGAWTTWNLEVPDFITKEQQFTVGVVAAQSTNDLTMGGGGLPADAAIWVSPITLPPPGITATGYINTSGEVVVRVANVTAASVDCGTMTFKAGVLRDLN